MDRLVKLEVLGQEYQLYTDAPEEDVEEILNLVKSQLEGDKNPSSRVLPDSKLAVLSTLNMAGMYVKMKKEYEQYRQQVEGYTHRLMQKIEDTI